VLALLFYHKSVPFYTPPPDHFEPTFTYRAASQMALQKPILLRSLVPMLQRSRWSLRWKLR